MKWLYVSALFAIIFVGAAVWVAFSEMIPHKSSNPFAINFPPKENLSVEDYVEVQKQLRAIDLKPLIEEMHSSNEGNIVCVYDIFRRCTCGLRQEMIDPSKNQYPSVHLEKIGRGGDRCFVSFCSFNYTYSKFCLSIKKALEDTGFNGYFYYRIGGFPNPTGKEIQYAGVPYTFKIFMMLEAQKLGFNNVIWLDTAMLPLRDPTPLFDHLEEKGCLLLHYVDREFDAMRIFTKTRSLLKDLTGVDIVEKHFSTGLFGLKMNEVKTKKLIEFFYKCVEMGTPFLSCFPEEYVVASFFQQSEKDWPSDDFRSVLRFSLEVEDFLSIKAIKDAGFYFYLRDHRIGTKNDLSSIDITQL